MRYEAILFDFDGVLVDSEPVHFECWQEILRDFDLQMDWKTYCEFGIGVSDRDLMGLICQRAGRPHTLVEELMAAYPRKNELFLTLMLERRLFTKDTLDLLPQLHEYQLGVVTSSGRSEVEPLLQDAGVHGLFRAMVYGGDVKRLKPAPDPYLLAVKKLGVRTALVVEDSEAGEASARAAGLDVLRIRTQQEMPGLLRQRLG